MTIQEQLEEANITADELETNESENQSQSDNESESQSDVEERARAMGWKPLDEYEGNPERHISAEKFLRRGMEKLPILQKNYTELQNKFADTERKLREMREFQAHMSDVQYKRALRDIQEQQRKAVEDGDTAAYDTLEKQKEEVQKEFSPKQPDQSQDPYANLQKQKTLLDWNKRNEWYQKDKTLQIEADIYFKELELSGTDLPLNEKLAYVEQKVKELNPQKFSSQRRAETPPNVHGGGNRKVEKGAGKTWNDIPKEDLATAEKWVSKGLMTKEEYVKSYFGENK